MTPEQKLLARPTFEQASREYLVMLTEMRTAISRIAPNLQWEKDPFQDGESLCERPYTKIKGATHGIFSSGDAQGAIADADWPAVVTAVSGIAAQYRFTRVQGLVDKPGNHRLVMHDSWGGTVEMGSIIDSSLVVYSPCLLTESARYRISKSASSSPTRTTW